MAAVKARVTLDVSGLEELREKWGALAGAELAVGFQGPEAAERYKETGANVASVALYNEFGTPAGPNHAGIPAGSFLRSSVCRPRQSFETLLFNAKR